MLEIQVYNEKELSSKISADLNVDKRILDEKIGIIDDLGKKIETALQFNKTQCKIINNNAINHDNLISNTKKEIIKVYNFINNNHRKFFLRPNK